MWWSAGKSTTINILTGVLPPSGGDAVMVGESIRTPGAWVSTAYLAC